MRWFAVAGATALAATACGGPAKSVCSSIGSLEVSLVDTDSEAPLCQATVSLASATGGGSGDDAAGPPEPLVPEGGMGAGCYYFTAVMPGTYMLTVMNPGYITLNQSLTVTTDGCSTESPQLALELLPSM